MAVLMREAIGDTLRRARTARRRTLRDVSRRARVSLGYLSEVERGRKEPSSELLAAICAALDLALHDLLGEAAELMARDALVLSRAAQVTRPIGLRHASLRFADDELSVRPIGAADPVGSGAPETTGSPMISAPTATMGFTSATVPTPGPSAVPQSTRTGGRPMALAAVGGVRVAA